MSDVDEKLDLVRTRDNIKRMALEEKAMSRSLRKLRRMLKQKQAHARAIAHGVTEAEMEVDAEGLFTARSSPRCSFPVPVPISNPPKTTLEPAPKPKTMMSDVDEKPDQNRKQMHLAEPLLFFDYETRPGCPTSEYTDGTGASAVVTLEMMLLRKRQNELMCTRDDIKRMALEEKTMLRALRKLRTMLNQAWAIVHRASEADTEADAEGVCTSCSSFPASSRSSPRCSVPVPISNPPKTMLEPGPSSTQLKIKWKILGVSKKPQKPMQMQMQKAVQKLRKRRALQLVPMQLRKEKPKPKQKILLGDTDEMEEKLLLDDMDEKEKQVIQCVTKSSTNSYNSMQRKMAAEKVMEVLHIVACQGFAEHDPKMDAFVFTRVCTFNLALLDLDEESEAIHGPRLQDLDRKWSWISGWSINVLSLKVLASAVGYPISVFGTVLARDQVDYRCVYLFKREKNHPLLINKPEDMLTLTGPSRGFQFWDRMFFEINLKIKGDETTPDRDLSKGVIQIRAREDPRTVATQLNSWLSTVELVYAPVQLAVEASIEVRILNGPLDVPFDVKITAWVAGNKKDSMILYEYDEDRSLVEHTVGLNRNLVHVPMRNRPDHDSLVTVCFSDDKLAPVEVDIHYPLEEKCCSHGSYELQVKVAWTAIQPMSESTEALLGQRYGIVPDNTFMSWYWELLENCCWAVRSRFV